jgi:hypothetical protein
MNRPNWGPRQFVDGHYLEHLPGTFADQEIIDEIAIAIELHFLFAGDRVPPKAVKLCEIDQSLAVIPPVKACGHALDSIARDRIPIIGIVVALINKRLDAGRNQLGLAGIQQQTADAELDDLQRASEFRSEGRQPGRHRLDNRQAECLK